jgi:type II secretory pathway component PulF
MSRFALSRANFSNSPSSPRSARAAARRAAVGRLATLVGSGIPLADALAAGGRAGGEAGRILAQVSRTVARGRPLSQAMGNVAGCSATEVALVAAGEASGQLNRALALLNERMTHDAESRHRLSRALVYPAVLIVLTLAIVTAMGIFVVPTFADMYAGLGVSLPATTRVLIAVADGATRHALGVLTVTSVAAALVSVVVRTRPRVRLGLHAALLDLPGIGRSLRVAAKHDLYATLAALLAAGVELDRAIALAEPAVANAELRRRLHSVGDLLRRGWLPSAAIVRAGLDPDGLDAGLVKTAEATGDYAQCFGHLAAAARAERDERSELLSRLLEPAAVVIMALAVALTVLGVYQPILGSATLLIGDFQ